MKDMTLAEWNVEGERRFGPDRMKWKFVCPVCGHVAATEDWKAAGATEGAVAFSCVGRWIEGSKKAFEEKGIGPCTYAGGGLFRLNPVRVLVPGKSEAHELFDFAEVK
jgi:hypothetical protein